MTIFDTNILIDYLRGKEEALEIMTEGHSEISITVITGYELLKGYRYGKEEAAVNELLNRVKIYHTDSKSMRVSGTLYRELKNIGRLKNEADVLIAGIVIANNETLVTRDPDFSDFSDLLGDSLILLR